MQSMAILCAFFFVNMTIYKRAMVPGSKVTFFSQPLQILLHKHNQRNFQFLWLFYLLNNDSKNYNPMHVFNCYNFKSFFDTLFNALRYIFDLQWHLPTTSLAGIFWEIMQKMWSSGAFSNFYFLYISLLPSYMWSK